MDGLLARRCNDALPCLVSCSISLSLRRSAVRSPTLQHAEPSRAPTHPTVFRRSGPAGLEDGTPAFTSIAAARHGFAVLRRLGGLPAVHAHACTLATWLVRRLAALRHANGAPVCELYGRWCRKLLSPSSCTATATTAQSGDHHYQSNSPHDHPDHGPTVAFNLRRPDGSWVGYSEVLRLAAMHGLVLRAGCFCNPGACAEWLGLSAEDMIANHA